MPTVELLYAPDCPNVPAAREQLRRAYDAIGESPNWTEIDTTAQGAPARVCGYGSPTILVDGEDITGSAPGGGPSCRIYVGSDVRGVPQLDVIVAALRGSTPPRSPAKAASLAVIPGALLSLLPVVSCPSCWPAYAGALGALGVPFLMDTSWLLPLTVGALVLALLGLGYRGRRRRGFGPVVLGAFAATSILLGKFALELNGPVYVGTALLLAASVWNSWPKKQTVACEGCAS